MVTYHRFRARRTPTELNVRIRPPWWRAATIFWTYGGLLETEGDRTSLHDPALTLTAAWCTLDPVQRLVFDLDLGHSWIVLTVYAHMMPVWHKGKRTEKNVLELEGWTFHTGEDATMR